MIDNIITLIIAEAKAKGDISFRIALNEVMQEINTIITCKDADLGRVKEMEIPEEEKDRIVEVILQAD